MNKQWGRVDDFVYNVVKFTTDGDREGESEVGFLLGDTVGITEGESVGF